MIQIDDNDSPITVAEKIINGTKPYDYPTEGWNNHFKAITGNDCNEQNMFDLNDIKEIANYLRVYCEWHENGD